MTLRPRRLLTLLVGLLAGVLLLAGCGFSVYSLPLPGGTDTGKDPITVKIQFSDALDLVPDSTVKVDDVSVGTIKSVDLQNGVAVVTAELRRDTRLPANATAEIQQTSLLGEKFIDLETPSDPSSTLLQSGDTIPLARTGQNPEIEQVLGALSLILNGGGVAQLKTISTELNKALGGHEDAARSVISEVDSLVGNLDANKSSIVEALSRLNTLSQQVRGQEDTIDKTLDELPAALTSLDAQRKDLVAMLQSLDRLGKTGVRVITQSKDNVIAAVKDLQPTLTELAASGDHLVNTLSFIPTFPFPDASVGTTAAVARNVKMGDYLNLDITLDLDYSSLLGSSGKPPTLLPPTIAPTKVVDEVLQCLTSGSLTSQACKDVLGSVQALTDLLNQCKKAANKSTTVCQLLNTVPGLPNVGSLLPSQLGSLVSSLPLVGGLLGGGQPRAPAELGTPGPDGTRRVTVGELDSVYDPDLVALMVPGLGSASAPASAPGSARKGGRS
jgi:phospholipid/cholesterol/gamma-HCH transport system substrate-binding protein